MGLSGVLSRWLTAAGPRRSTALERAPISLVSAWQGSLTMASRPPALKLMARRCSLPRRTNRFCAAVSVPITVGHCRISFFARSANVTPPCSCLPRRAACAFTKQTPPSCRWRVRSARRSMHASRALWFSRSSSATCSAGHPSSPARPIGPRCSRGRGSGCPDPRSSNRSTANGSSTPSAPPMWKRSSAQQRGARSTGSPTPPMPFAVGFEWQSPTPFPSPIRS